MNLLLSGSPRSNVRKLRPLRSKLTPIMTTTTRITTANSTNTNTNDNVDNNDGHYIEPVDKEHNVKNVDDIDVGDDYYYDYDARAAADNDNIEAGKKGYVVDDDNDDSDGGGGDDGGGGGGGDYFL